MITFKEYLTEIAIKGKVVKAKPHWDDLSKEEQSEYLDEAGNITITNDLLDNNGELKIIFPNEWNKSFYCYNTNITSLIGIPKTISHVFNIDNCIKLTSLKYAPELVGISFVCSRCIKLTSLKYAPKKVSGNFACNDCIKLISLNYAPKEVGGNFNCRNCKVTFTEEDVRRVSNVKERIIV